MKQCAITFSGVGRRFGENGGGNLMNVQCKSIGNWHNETPLHNEYMQIKMKKKTKKGKKNH
jgi:hypothetical protein